MEKEFLVTTKQNKYMGLNNTICKDPVYFCPIHQVYLSEADAKAKKCFCKPTFDMMSTYRCPSLILASEHQKKNQIHHEIVNNLKKSNRNRAMDNFT